MQNGKRLVTTKQIEFIDAEETKGMPPSQAQMQLSNKVVQIAMNLANDSLQTSLCLQAGPDKIATACLFLAFQFAATQPTQDKSWLEILGYPDVELLMTISIQIIDLIAERKGIDEAILSKVRSLLDKMKDEEVVIPLEGEPAAKKFRSA